MVGQKNDHQWVVERRIGRGNWHPQGTVTGSGFGGVSRAGDPDVQKNWVDPGMWWRYFPGPGR